MNELNYTNSIWTSTNSTCKFPKSIFLDILTSKAGAVNNPQQYVVAARLSYKSEEISFNFNDPNMLINVSISFIVNFIPLDENLLTATRNAPSIIPGLPSDIALPLITN